MTIHPPGSHSRESKALQRKQALIDKYVAEGMSAEAAAKRAQAEMRDNDKGDWRRG